MQEGQDKTGDQRLNPTRNLGTLPYLGWSSL